MLRNQNQKLELLKMLNWLFNLAAILNFLLGMLPIQHKIHDYEIKSVNSTQRISREGEFSASSTLKCTISPSNSIVRVLTYTSIFVLIVFMKGFLRIMRTELVEEICTMSKI